ncbi:MAG: ThiF family adenylyltransferase [Chloroflexi bacterium]|nr:ThiF family adenylyltransferase [Chloroflexota bacterium]
MYDSDFFNPRYSRQELFYGIGYEGQEMISESRVLILGMGALGTHIADALCRAGVGYIRIVDRDYVELSNLQRQCLFDEEDALNCTPKAVAAKEKLLKINSSVEIESHVTDFNPHNAVEFCTGVHLVMDATDNFPARFLLNDVCLELGTTWIYGAALGSLGMSMVIIPGETPCYNCLVDGPPPPGLVPTCDTAGVLAPAIMATASVQVMEALKILSGEKEKISPFLTTMDLWENIINQYRIRPREDCPSCSRNLRGYLKGDDYLKTTKLCGNQSFQVTSKSEGEIDLEDMAQKLGRLGKVKKNPYLIAFSPDDKRTITVFKEGRALIRGVSTEEEALSLYSQFIGA